LASVAALSILTIISHHRNHVQHASLILHHSRPAARLIPAPPQQHLSNREHGTRVNVQDIFGSMPVRVKRRALESVNGESEKQLEVLKRHVLGLLLAWHQPVSISLRTPENKKGLYIRCKDTRTSEGEGENSSKNLDLPLVCRILSQAGCIEPSDWADWIKTSARTPFITIRGAISLQPAPSKQVQFISLGLRPLSAEKDGNVLYDEVNRLFSFSSFGNQEEILDTEGSANTRRDKDRRFKQAGFTTKQLKGGGKGVDRWPMFYIRIEMHNADRVHVEDVEKLGEGTLTGLLKVLDAMITGFLDENHFRPRARARKREPELSRPKEAAARSLGSDFTSNTPDKTSTKYQDDTFGAWGRIKSGVHVKSSAVSPTPSSVVPQSAKPTSSIEGPTSLRIEPSVSSQPSETIDASNPKPNSILDEQTVDWINPISGARVLINARTGLVIAPQITRRPTSAPSHLRSSASPFTTIHNDAIPEKRLTRTAPSSHDGFKTTPSSSDVLRTWENPVFGITEEAIPQVSLDGPSLESSDILHGRRHCCSDAEVQKAFTQSSSSFSAKLTRQGLKDATVISQVDRKFILVSMPDKSSVVETHTERPRQLLVLVDQHAADERIRVEALLAELIPPPTPLAKPITFEISLGEQGILTRHIPYFTSWGIIYTITSLPSSPTCRLTVKALPTPIAERCRVEPKLLIELLRGEAWKREDLGLSSKPATVPSTPSQPLDPKTPTKPWLPHLSTIPQSLLDMLNSRACRSAIMFNDVLDVAECTTLIRRLAECVFPFQCAHGRPSMVPVVDVGGEGGDGRCDGGEGVEGGSFGEAWRGWRGKAEG